MSRPLRRGSAWAVLGLLWRGRGRALLAGAALAAATALAGMALLGLSGWFISATAFAGLSAATAVVFDVFAPSAGIRLLALGRTGLRYAERLVTHDATLAVLAGRREQLFRGWAQPRAARRLLARPARLLFRLTADVDALDALYLRVAVPLAILVVAALVAGLAWGLVAPLAGLALAAGVGLGGSLLAWRCTQRAQAPARRRVQAQEQLRALGIDLVAGQTELAMAGRLVAQCEAIAAADARLQAAETVLNRLEARTAGGLGVLTACTLAGALLLAGWLVAQDRVGVPVAVCLLLVALAATEPLAALRRGALDLGRALQAARRLGPRLQPQPDAVLPPAPAPGLALWLDQVHAAPVEAAPAVLHGCSLQLRAGERVALVGASGAGKSTLLALAAGELLPLAGQVAVGPACLMTQRSELFADSLRENLLLARPEADDAALWQALQAAGLDAFVRGLPAGLDTRLGEGGLGLSGGQARRLALARLLLRDAPLWLLDEPTEAVDAATARDVLARLAASASGRSLLLATHLRREAALADRLVLLAQGRIAADLRRGDPAFERLLMQLRPD